MNKLLRIVLVIISVAIGATFLYSAYTKFGALGFEGWLISVLNIPFRPPSGNALQSFEYTIVEYTHLPWLLAAISARFFIGLETALGALMLLHLFGSRKWVLKAALAILIIFSIYLVYLWITQGNDVNCGCFGDTIWMSPSSSLIKNGLLIIGIALLLKFHHGFNKKWARITSVVLGILITILPFIMYALPDEEPTWLKKDSFEIKLSALYNPEAAQPVPSVDLNKGKYIISFMSLSCQHCRMAAHKMHIMHEKNPGLPFYFVLAGKEKYEKSFWEETRAINIPHTKLDADSFTAIAGYAWPVIYFVNNGWVEAQSNYISLSQDEIEKWLAK